MGERHTAQAEGPEREREREAEGKPDTYSLRKLACAVSKKAISRFLDPPVFEETGFCTCFVNKQDLHQRNRTPSSVSLTGTMHRPPKFD